MQLEINPEGIDSAYLRCLNTCFPGWGDTQMAQWALRRALSPDPSPDLIVLRQEDELLAGSAVSYRSVILPNGSSVRAGIMTGSWTLPAARGQGCFSRMIEESAAITREREGTLLLAFVTEENPSCRQLLKAGAAPFPTWYLLAGPAIQEGEASVAPGLVIAGEAELADLVPLWAEARAGKCRFSYSCFEDWKRQFVDRPGRIDTVRNTSGSFAILERTPTTNKILAWWALSQASELQLFRELRADAQTSGRKLFSFSTDAEFTTQCEGIGFKRIPGYLALMVVDWERLGEALQTTASPTTSNHALLDPLSHWFTGQWDLQSGDRM